MTTKVDAMIDALVGREGGYSNNPADKGGPTRWGITEHVARAYGYAGDMRSLPRETALAIYRERYWTGVKFDQVAAIYPRVAEEMFDTGVNMGQAVAAGFLQRALNLLNRGASDYPDIAADGALGKMSLFALRSFQAKRGSAGEAVLLKTLDGFQLGRYADITEAREANETFFYGWVANRVGALP
jgi:lysozyme family protein